MLAAAIDRMHEDGNPVSTLYPSNPPVYRASGWEIAGVLASVDLPTIGMPAGAPGQVALRALDRDAPAAADLASVHTLYTAAAKDAIGPLTRTGPEFDPAKIAEHDVVIGAIDGVDAGYVSWSRRGDRLQVHDLIADRPVVRDTLLSCVGSWQTTIDTARIRVGDPVFGSFALPRGAVLKQEPWMLRIVDAPAAVAARGFGPVAGAVDLLLTDPQAPWNEGRWQLSVADGAGTLTRGGTGAVELNARGLAALFTGYAGASGLQRGGLATGDPAALVRLAGLFAGPTPWMLDEF
jgi:predicted acetyltransferase